MNLLQPDIFKRSNKIEAVFTEANRDIIHPERQIPGLNLGINTAEDKDVIRQNTKSLFSYLKWNPELLAEAGQTHGTTIQIADKPGFYEATDGLITNKKNLALGIRVADCAAVLIADPVNRVIGAFHAGWKGAAGGIVPEGIEKMEALSGKTENFLVFISPCISLKSFEVDEDVAARFPDEFIDRTNFKKAHVNLKDFVSHQLSKSGVPEQQIEVSGECTVQNSRFFSYRRERDNAGRMLALIKLKP